MRSLLVLFLFLISCALSFSQEKMIEGRIVIDVDDETPEGIMITNSRTQITSITDLTGSFSLRVQENDELIIRSALFESRNFIIRKSMMDKALIQIHLNYQPVILDEAVITEKLTGYLDKDVKYKPSKDVIAKLYKDIGINPDNGKLRDSTALKPWKEQMPFTLNVEGIFGAITGDTRRKRNLYEFEDKDKRIHNIKDYLGDNYFVDDLNIPQEKIIDFIYYSFDNSSIPTYYEKGDYLSIMVELNITSKNYLNRLEKWHLPLKNHSK